NDQCLVIEIL
nr:RecName: Full=Toxin To83; AltName: Full=Toxin Tc83 [Tityus obscurus]